LKAKGGDLVSPSDLPHRAEHSIEFQLIFLQHVLGGDFAIVPVLCGNMADMLPKVDRASDIAGIRGFLDCLRDYLRQPNTACVAGVDLSHIGPKFGDDAPAHVIEEEARKHDEKLLDALCKRDGKAFWAEAKRVNDRYHVCGFSALATMIEILPDCSGEVLQYKIRHEAETRSAVSFAAVAFVKR